MNKIARAVMRVTSSRGAGQAFFVRCGDSSLASSPYFNNRRFLAFKYGDSVLVTFSVGKVRTLIHVIAIPPGVNWRELDLDSVTVFATSPTEPVLTEPTPTEPMLTEPTPIEPLIEPMPKALPIHKNWLGDTYFSGEMALAFEGALKMAKIAPVNMLIVGPSGYGKTTLPQAVADNVGMKCLRMNCASIRDAEEWFGYREARDGSTVFVTTEFTQAVVEGNTIIILDEFNRIEPWLHNTLYPLLDDTHATSIHGEHIKCGPNLIFVATINDGAAFTGTYQLDAALVNRFDMVTRVSPLPFKVETNLLSKRFPDLTSDLIRKIVIIMGDLRDYVEKQELGIDVSTRSSLKIARLMTTGMGLKDAFNLAIANSVSIENVKGVVDLISQKLAN